MRPRPLFSAGPSVVLASSQLSLIRGSELVLVEVSEAPMAQNLRRRLLLEPTLYLQDSPTAVSPFRFLPPLLGGYWHLGSLQLVSFYSEKDTFPPPTREPPPSTWVPHLPQLLGPHSLQLFSNKVFLQTFTSFLHIPVSPSLADSSLESICPQVLLLG